MAIEECEPESCWNVLVVSAGGENASWFMRALAKSTCFKIVRVAKNPEEARLYISQAKLVILDLPETEATALSRFAKAQVLAPLVVALTSADTTVGELKALQGTADCLQERPKCMGETIAFVDWLDEWKRAMAEPQKAMMRFLFRVAAGIAAATKKSIRIHEG